MTTNAATMRTANSEQRTANSYNNALVTIIIPAYNTEQYIHRAIESSIRQTYKNIEIIIIDDGSTDGTLRVAQSYETQDDRIRVIHQENKGVSSARNHGIREAKGEYITFMDSDDWFEDDAVEVLVETQKKYPDKFICSCKYLLTIDDKNKIFHRPVKHKKYDSREFNIQEVLINLDDVEFRSALAKIFKTDIIRKNNLYVRENLYYGEDFVFNFSYLSKVKSLFYVNKPLINVLIRPGSANNTPYDEKKIFIDGKINDWGQIIIDYPENTPEVRQAAKFCHTRLFLEELIIGTERHGNTHNINHIIEKIRLYLPEYMNKPDISHKAKIYYYAILNLPLPIVRIMCRLRIYARAGLNRIRRLFKKKDEEIINFW